MRWIWLALALSALLLALMDADATARLAALFVASLCLVGGFIAGYDVGFHRGRVHERLIP